MLGAVHFFEYPIEIVLIALFFGLSAIYYLGSIIQRGGMSCLSKLMYIGAAVRRFFVCQYCLGTESLFCAFIIKLQQAQRQFFKLLLRENYA